MWIKDVLFSLLLPTLSRLCCRNLESIQQTELLLCHYCRHMRPPHPFECPSVQAGLSASVIFQVSESAVRVTTLVTHFRPSVLPTDIIRFLSSPRYQTASHCPLCQLSHPSHSVQFSRLKKNVCTSQKRAKKKSNFP